MPDRGAGPSGDAGSGGGPASGGSAVTSAIRHAPAEAAAPLWHRGTDVRHPDFGHGWVQGAGHGRVTVRFETRSTGPGSARTFAADDPALSRADPLGSLD